ncbi:MAG: DEAD/DEAH box helicase [Phycisphaerales bacterium]|nr:DEAD/DEAH box helicase [Phycisphaerales bacterium]
MGFDELGLEDWLLRSVASIDLGAPTQLQAEVIPPALRGDDLLVGASAGAGKTAAYGLPLLQRIQPERGLQAMVVVPTKELAARVQSRIRRMSGEREFQIIAAFPARDRRGESEMPVSIDGEILVGTPGRILDLIERGAIDLNYVRLLILEEFDRMLAMELLERVQRVVQNLPPEHQTIVLADRLDSDVREAAIPLLHEPQEIRLAESEQSNPLEFRAIDIGDASRMPAVLGFLEAERPRRILIVAASDHESRSTIHSLRDAGYRTETLGERPQRRDFGRGDRGRPRRSGGASVHVDSRLPSRGADLAYLSHVLFLHTPYETAEFAHQMNRLGRLVKEGVVVLFAADEELDAYPALQTALGVELTPATPAWVHGPTGDGPSMDDDDRSSVAFEGEDGASGEEAREPRGGRDGERGRGGRDRGDRDRGRGGRDRGRGGGGRGGDGERRGRGGGGGGRSRGGSRGDTPAPAAPASNRFSEALRRDAELEARGIMPIPRTLGSRFKPAGRSRGKAK